ncbi:ABC transporter ATP-binding protein [Clostridium botulinum]|uniref:ABC transporter ATP-binding protein n=1 Tax=Clostridium botulinum TaxID=1491 RepID=UPI001A936441|nr:ABC transporter ATP-binding protein [Clostridium botulinum]MBO0524588.1 ABC transporter ATP-binding protein [Clostridium botulinum]MBO0528131.1 ABC transporter ATP-binding protein [Clostridium botulinum]MBO0539311.1 ABC transporter ATP-binding protein [Clostridium botulinum]MBO0548962.1 ABC transporter ATP-binding protein [Clostridium botulinum]MBO0554666.1 ABC transporter ATP-binding protein [Clostridium botulinum]
MKLKIDNLTKKYSDKVAVKDFSIEMTEGVYGLLGPNGAGKTTLMRMISDVLNPTCGQILVNNVDKNDLGEEYRDLLGYLPQDMGYYKNFTAERFLKYVAALKGLNKKMSKERIEELLEVVGLSEYKNKKVGKFSGGMRQRVGIAQALLNNPKILVLDEPTAGLDPKERIRFRNLISDISKDRIIILSTHIVGDIEYIAKQVILIKEGQLIKSSTGDKLLKEMEGKAWKVEVDEKNIVEYEEKYQVVNIMRKRDKVQLRILSNNKPGENAIDIDPNFEDMYMHYFNEKIE